MLSNILVLYSKLPEFDSIMKSCSMSNYCFTRDHFKKEINKFSPFCCISTLPSIILIWFSMNAPISTHLNVGLFKSLTWLSPLSDVHKLHLKLSAVHCMNLGQMSGHLLDNLQKLTLVTRNLRQFLAPWIVSHAPLLVDTISWRAGRNSKCFLSLYNLNLLAGGVVALNKLTRSPHLEFRRHR